MRSLPEAELDLRLHCLLFLADGVYAIAVTLLAVELVLPEAAADLHVDCGPGNDRITPDFEDEFRRCEEKVVGGS